MRTRYFPKRKRAGFRKNSYEASLTPEELEQFHDLVRSGKNYKEMCAGAVPWRDGELQGQKPCKYTIYRIKARLDLEDMLQDIEGTAALVEGTKRDLDALVKGSAAEKVLDRAMALIGQEVIHRTLKRLDPVARTAAAKLLLKRADQRRMDRRLAVMEAKVKKDEPDKSGDELTSEEKQLMTEVLSV